MKGATVGVWKSVVKWLSSGSPSNVNQLKGEHGEDDHIEDEKHDSVPEMVSNGEDGAYQDKLNK